MTFAATILTLYPEMFPGPLGVSLAGRALERGDWSCETVQIRDFATDKHRTVDDTPSGGGPGMVMRADVAAAAIDAVDRAGRPLIYLSPRGRHLDQARVRELAANLELKAALPVDAAIEKVVTIFRELRTGQTIDGKNKVKSPSGVLSTAEAISVVTNGLALAAHFDSVLAVDGSGAQFALIFGGDELARGEVTLKALRDGAGGPPHDAQQIGLGPLDIGQAVRVPFRLGFALGFGLFFAVRLKLQDYRADARLEMAVHAAVNAGLAGISAHVNRHPPRLHQQPSTPEKAT